MNLLHIDAETLGFTQIRLINLHLLEEEVAGQEFRATVNGSYIVSTSYIGTDNFQVHTTNMIYELHYDTPQKAYNSLKRLLSII